MDLSSTGQTSVQYETSSTSDVSFELIVPDQRSQSCSSFVTSDSSLEEQSVPISSPLDLTKPVESNLSATVEQEAACHEAVGAKPDSPASPV